MRLRNNICGANYESITNTNDYTNDNDNTNDNTNIKSRDIDTGINTYADNDNNNSKFLSLVSTAKTTVMTTITNLHSKFNNNNDDQLQQQTFLLNRSKLSSISSSSTLQALTSSSSATSTANTNDHSFINNNNNNNKLDRGGLIRSMPTCSSDLSILPSPGSKGCIWRGALRQVADNYKVSRHTSNIPKDPKKLEFFVKSIMKDDSSFAGRSGVILRSLYVDMVFYSSEDALNHGLECLDSIACAFFLNYNDNDIETSMDLLNTITNTIDKHVLGAYRGVMYKKLFQAASLLSQDADQQLYEVIRKKRRNTNTILIDPRNKQNAIICLNGVRTKMTASEKLSCLTLSIEHLARSDESSYTNHNDNENNQNMSVDADVMIQRLEYLLFEDICQSGTTTWFAECTYINLMMRDTEGMLGMNGYALTSLHQALDSLLRSGHS